jgi:hypothetical protein
MTKVVCGLLDVNGAGPTVRRVSEEDWNRNYRPQPTVAIRRSGAIRTPTD